MRTDMCCVAVVDNTVEKRKNTINNIVALLFFMTTTLVVGPSSSSSSSRIVCRELYTPCRVRGFPRSRPTNLRSTTGRLYRYRYRRYRRRRSVVGVARWFWFLTPDRFRLLWRNPLFDSSIVAGTFVPSCGCPPGLGTVRANPNSGTPPTVDGIDSSWIIPARGSACRIRRRR